MIPNKEMIVQIFFTCWNSEEANIYSFFYYYWHNMGNHSIDFLAPIFLFVTDNHL